MNRNETMLNEVLKLAIILELWRLFFLKVHAILENSKTMITLILTV